MVQLVHSCLVYVCCFSVLQVSAVLQPLVTNDPPPTYFKTDKFTSCFQVQQGLHNKRNMVVHAWSQEHIITVLLGCLWSGQVATDHHRAVAVLAWWQTLLPIVLMVH
jgi:hypothetical protein